MNRSQNVSQFYVTKTEHERLLKSYKKVLQERNFLKTSGDEYVSTIDMLRLAVSGYGGIIKKLNTECNKTNPKLVAQIEEQMRQMKKDHEKQARKNEAYKQSINDMFKLISSIVGYDGDDEFGIKQLQDYFNNQVADIANKKKDIDRLDKLKNKALDENKVKDEEINLIKGYLENVEKINENFKKDNHKLKGDIDDLKKEITKLNKEKTQMKNDFDQDKAQMKNDFEQLVDGLQKKNDQEKTKMNDDFDKYVDDLKTKNNQTLRQIDDNHKLAHDKLINEIYQLKFDLDQRAKISDNEAIQLQNAPNKIINVFNAIIGDILETKLDLKNMIDKTEHEIKKIFQDEMNKIQNDYIYCINLLDESQIDMNLRNAKQYQYPMYFKTVIQGFICGLRNYLQEFFTNQNAKLSIINDQNFCNNNTDSALKHFEKYFGTFKKDLIPKMKSSLKYVQDNKVTIDLQSDDLKFVNALGITDYLKKNTTADI